jgi:hypothetical protein
MAGRRKVDGTHQGDKSNVPNTCAPRSRRQKPTKAEAKLEARIKAWQSGMKGSKFDAHQPGSLNRKKG